MSQIFISMAYYAARKAAKSKPDSIPLRLSAVNDMIQDLIALF
ncbi:hypothetical protein [Aliikangiella sp. G2MR2-5]|nr:hypothetical protein [Aliikangiella sp. G2MR2-5]